MKARSHSWLIASMLVMITALILLPIWSMVGLALGGKTEQWAHLMATVLPRYTQNSVILMIGVGALSGMIGTGAAWLISRWRFPLSGMLDWMLLMPLAVPAYLSAYALVDFWEYAGPAQTHLRALMGWASPEDYWFPPVRSRAMAILVLSFSLYPYVYLLARTAFIERSAHIDEVARSLGRSQISIFCKISFPMARPAIAVGVTLAMMEALNDLGTVEFFAVQTLTTGIFTTWLEKGDAGGAAQIALVSLVLIAGLIWMERRNRAQMKFYNRSSGLGMALAERRPLRGWAGLLAMTLCLIPIGFGFLMPVGILLDHALKHPHLFVEDGLLSALGTTLFTSGVAAVLAVVIAFAIVSLVQFQRFAGFERTQFLTRLGYATPGAVLGLGLLIPIAWVDNSLADGIWALTGYDPGLLITGSSGIIILAYWLRFFGIAQGGIEAAFHRIPPNLARVAHTLGQTERGVMQRVFLPLSRRSLIVLITIIFVDCVKELPATLLLRPFGFSTLATRAYDFASLEDIARAAPAALLIILTGLGAVGIAARNR